MVNIGAVQTVIPHDVMIALGLEAPRQRGVEYADGRTEIVPVTDGNLLFK